MPLPKLFKNKRKLRREPPSSKQFSSRYHLDAILSQEFVINLKSRAKSPTDLLDIVGYPHISNASSPDLLSPVESSSSQKRQQRPSLCPRRASLHSFSPATNNHLSSSRAVTAASIATTSTTTAVAIPSSSHQIFQHQESQKDKKPKAVGVTVYNNNNSNNKNNNGHQHPLPSSSSPPALIMPTPKMAVPQTKQILLQSNNPWADKTLKEEDDEQHPAGYSRDVDPLSRASAPYEFLVPPPPAPSAPNQSEEQRHHRRSRSEISVLYDKLRSYHQEQEIWAQREKEHRIREEWMMKKLQETRTQLKQLQLEAYQQQQSQPHQQQQRHIIDEAFCDEPSETSDIQNEETNPQRTNQNYAWQRQYCVPETYYNEEQEQEEENEENCSYYSEEEEYDDNNKSSGYVSEEDEDDEEEQDESQEEISQPRRRHYIHQQQRQRQHQHQRHSLHRHHPLHNPQLHPAAAAYYFYHLLSMDHVRPWSAVYHHQQQQQQHQQQLMENRPPHFYYYGYPQPQQPPPLPKRRSRKSSDTSVRSVPSLRHSNSTMSSGKGTTNNTHPRNSLPPEFTGDNFYSWNRTAYL